MAKVAAASALSSDVFPIGNIVAFEDYLAVFEQQNYSAAECVQRFAWSGDLTLGAGVVGLAGFIWIPPWADQVDLFLDWSGSGVDVAVNTVNRNPASGSQSISINTTSTGTGLQEFRIQVGPTPAASLPSPVVE